MLEIDHIHDLFSQRKPAHSLPQGLYLDAAAYEFDLRAIFERNWVMIGFECELPSSGSYLAAQVGRSQIVVIRDKTGEIRGFHNSCRHRGAQICPTGTGRAPLLVCPYHQWSYDLTGTLKRAPGMDETFELNGHGLRPIHVELVAGCVYVCLAEQAPDFNTFRTALEPAIAPFNLKDAKIAHVVELDEDANWKLVMENGRECHHCNACHPELKSAFPIEIGDNDFYDSAESVALSTRLQALGLDVPTTIADWFQISRFPFNEGRTSYSVTGGPLVKVPLIDVGEGNLGSLRWAIEPNNFCHVTADSAFMFNCNPTGPLKTKVTAKWLVHKDAVEGVDYDVEKLIHMWDMTNRQDKDLAENNQRGVNSIGYVPGPYSKLNEPFVINFVDWYCRTAMAYIESEKMGCPIAVDA